MGILTTLNLLDGFKDTTSKSKDAFLNASNNKYDAILNNRQIKTTVEDGNMNAFNSGNEMYSNASDTIDVLYMSKIAGITDKIKRYDNSFRKELTNAQKAFGKFSTNKNKKNFKNMLSHGGKALAKSTPLLGSAVLTGIGVGKATNYFEQKNKSDTDPINNLGNDLYPAVAGSVVTGAMIADGLANKSVTAPFQHAKKAVKKTMYSYPKKLLGRVGKSGKFLNNLAKTMGKHASHEIDEIYKYAGFSDRAKQILCEDFIGKGIEAIPYVAAPAAVSAIVGKDIKHGGRKIRDTYNDKIVVDVPTGELGKIASYDAKGYFKKLFTKDVPSKAVQGVSRALFPAAVVAITGHNITNAMEKIKPDSENSVPEGKARITIEMAPSTNQLEKSASDVIDESYNKMKQLNDNIQHIAYNDKKTNKSRVVLGVKKQQRLKD